MFSLAIFRNLSPSPPGHYGSGESLEGNNGPPCSRFPRVGPAPNEDNDDDDQVYSPLLNHSNDEGRKKLSHTRSYSNPTRILQRPTRTQSCHHPTSTRTRTQTCTTSRTSATSDSLISLTQLLRLSNLAISQLQKLPDLVIQDPPPRLPPIITNDSQPSLQSAPAVVPPHHRRNTLQSTSSSPTHPNPHHTPNPVSNPSSNTATPSIDNSQNTDDDDNVEEEGEHTPEQYEFDDLYNSPTVPIVPELEKYPNVLHYTYKAMTQMRMATAPSAHSPPPSSPTAAAATTRSTRRHSEVQSLVRSTASPSTA